MAGATEKSFNLFDADGYKSRWRGELREFPTEAIYFRTELGGPAMLVGDIHNP